MKLGIFCGSADTTSSIYKEEIIKFGELLGKNKIDLVVGGEQYGLMAEFSKTAFDAQSRITGIISQEHEAFQAHYLTYKAYVLDTKQRKERFLELSDAFCMLPGGIGTLDEFFGVLVLKQIKRHKKPIYILNIKGFWDHLIALLQHIEREKFLESQFIKGNPEENLYQVFDDPEEIIKQFLNLHIGT